MIEYLHWGKFISSLFIDDFVIITQVMYILEWEIIRHRGVF